MGFVKCGVVFGLVVALMASFSVSHTNPFDVIAMNSLYVSMEYPNLIGWIALGGDPCLDAWQGKTEWLEFRWNLEQRFRFIYINRRNVSAPVMSIDISDNHIGGDIPLSLPSTLRNLCVNLNLAFISGLAKPFLANSLARNQFSGRIPDTLYSLTQLLDLSFHNNQLSGEIPDVFPEMTSLINLDLSGNNLSGQLPPSMGILSSLTTLHLQNNRLTGSLDVVQDLPLEYLNVENNLFSGPIPEKLLGIPNFRRGTLPTAEAPWKQANGTSASETPKKETKDIERHDVGTYKSRIDEPNSKSSFERNNQEKVTKNSIAKLQDQYGPDNRRQEAYPKAQGEQDIDLKRMAAYSKQKDGSRDKYDGLGCKFYATSATASTSPNRFFTIATLQKYTNSFSEENFVGEGTLGSVYRAELPDGKLLAVKKLNGAASKRKDR
ncbi:hypothetical protein OIU76_029137 [Salix suchowensis]|nr:hypothetical protein OIU76_029137 [Salix suchowensis]